MIFNLCIIIFNLNGCVLEIIVYYSLYSNNWRNCLKIILIQYKHVWENVKCFTGVLIRGCTHIKKNLLI